MYLYSLDTLRPLFPKLPVFACLAAHWDLKYPAGLAEQSVIVAASNKRPLWYLLSQAACFLFYSFLWWSWTQKVQPEKEGSISIKPREVAGKEGRGFRFTQQYIYSSSTHDNTDAEVPAACPTSHPKSSWEQVCRPKWKLVVTCIFSIIQPIK